MTDCWYRYYDVQFARPLNEWDEPVGEGSVGVYLLEFPVIRLTPQGAWLEVDGGRRWTKRNSTRHFACPTKEEARESFIARKHAQIRIYQARIRTAEKAIRAAPKNNCGPPLEGLHEVLI